MSGHERTMKRDLPERRVLVLREATTNEKLLSIEGDEIPIPDEGDRVEIGEITAEHANTRGTVLGVQDRTFSYLNAGGDVETADGDPVDIVTRVTLHVVTSDQLSSETF